MDFQKALLRRVGKAIHEYNMIREGDRIAVGVSGGKDSLALLDALLLLHKRSPVPYTIQAFTVEQGKFLRPIEPLSDYMKARGVDWTYYRDEPSFRLLEDQPDHGCDLCSRFRRRAVYEIASDLGVNVVALGHTQDDFCEALLRNTLYTGRLSALPAVTLSRSKDFRLIRPLVFVSEETTLGYAQANDIPLTPCACSHRTGTVRRSLREFLDQVKQENPHVMENIVSAMKRIDAPRLLDKRFLDLDDDAEPEARRASEPEPLPVLIEETL
jgi:tRNA 2-thiocytidine biosynthesis protein TtcA